MAARSEADRFVDRVFLTKRRRPRLTRCAVLFIDLLGVSAMNRSRRVSSYLVNLERAVSWNYRDFLEPDSPWPAAFFSDTLVLAAPVREHGGEEAAIGGLVIQAAALQLNLINAGFFVRGGLSLGRMHLRDGLVFGPALVEAYALESSSAVHPRVVLSAASVDDTLRTELDFYASPMNSEEASLLLCDGDGRTFVNYLGLLFDEPDGLQEELAAHRDIVVAKLDLHRGDKHLWEKYRWVAEYHNAVVSRALPREPDLCVDGSAMTWSFTPFA